MVCGPSSVIRESFIFKARSANRLIIAFLVTLNKEKLKIKMRFPILSIWDNLANCTMHSALPLVNFMALDTANSQDAAAEPKSMARKRGRPKASNRHDAVVKLDLIIVGKAQMVAKARGKSLAEYLSEIIRGPVDRDFLKIMKSLEADSDAES
jgi:hypothetical protein